MQRPSGIGAFQFVVLASLRTTQLIRGCLPRVDGGHKNTVTAQLEVSQGKVKQEFAPPRDEVAHGAQQPI
jgi:DNA-directed RNA polymerase subunit K/omega